MKHFMSLVCFEYRKIWNKKSAVLTLALVLFFSIISVWGTLLGNAYIDGEIYESNYEGMIKEREYARAITGRSLDSALLLEAAAAYASIPEDANVYQSTQEFKKNARHYSAIYVIARQVYRNSSKQFGAQEFGKLTPLQAEQFYEARRETVEQIIDSTQMSSKAKNYLLEQDKKLKTPLRFSYMDGYTRFLSILYTTGLMAAFAMAICIAPLFSGEYTSGADQLILSSKYGKGALIYAKLFTGFTFAGGLSLLLTLQTYIQCLLTFGPDGSNTPIQVYMPLCVWSLTMKQAVFIHGLCVFFACLFTAAVTMVLSAKLRSPFGVIILVSILLFLPLIIRMPAQPLLPYQLFQLLPSNMMAFESIIDLQQYELFGLVIPPYIMMPAFATVCAAALTPFSYRAFKKHQIT